MTKRGWFAIPGVTFGDRTLAEQMMGVEPALAEAKDKTVLDLGCAEGCIALEFAKAGATVLGWDYNADLIETARSELAKVGPLPVAFELARIERTLIDPERPQFDIVLALAVLHKLPDPQAGVRFCAETARELVVIRLPKGSTGFIRSKHHKHMGADIPEILHDYSFTLEQTLDGPRGELVMHWRRIGLR